MIKWRSDRRCLCDLAHIMGCSQIANMAWMNERRTTHLVGLSLGAIFAIALMLNAVAHSRSDISLANVRSPIGSNISADHPALGTYRPPAE
jgi:hypothetical protein